MPSPSIRVRVDAQGRMVLPRGLRDEIVTVPGDVIVRKTSDGLLLSAAENAGTVERAADGLPVLSMGGLVRNADVLAAIDQERFDR